MFIWAAKEFPELFLNLYHSEQKQQHPIYKVVPDMDGKQMVKRWRLETTNPDQALWGLDDGDPRTAWNALWEFDDDQYTAYVGLVEELNQINAPVIIRIVRTSK